MRILLIHQFFLEDNEGGGSRWNEMSRIWTEAGHEVTVLAGMTHYMGNVKSNYDGKYFHISKNRDFVKVIRCHVSSGDKGFLSRIWSFLSFVFSGIFAGIFLAKEKYDMIIVTSPPLFVGLIAIFLSWWKNIPFVFEVRDLWPESAIDTGVLKNKYLIHFSFCFEKLIYRKAKRICVLTPAFQEILIREKHINADKIICIPNGADFIFSDKLLTSFDSHSFRKVHNLEDKFVITYVGAHGISNHLIQVLETAELLLDTKVIFLLIGNGAEKEDLIKESNHRKLTNVRSIGSVSKSEVFNYILASDIGLSVLKKTGIFKTIYSNKTFDYLSCKKPVLMAIDGISRQLIEEADAGLFVEPENPKDFAQKIRFYLNNPDIAKRQGENGYTFVKNHFDREVLAKVYLNYIRGI
ncbi:glycosyltransferase family 4 protein [Dyadobacter frigoris]|uniref:Glycosyltransferase family 4 protein n=1 Tax=Dyadobacter frigoris TaxID=2576211 RepID=A0A4U6DAW7_9BACT|nr:glycosyltransferase family 4 protein [Dyadobacter frigoris]TKT93875.1 glycosyltransferase family 4 protein [Dyadobacter frigoris]GLU50906.1 glycosyltransferase WbuB [Dyadobacter frigoris]